MSANRNAIALTTTSLLLVAALLTPPAEAGSTNSSPDCENAPKIAILTSPLAPWKGASLRVLFVSDQPLQSELSLIAPDGNVAAKSRERRGGPPYFWFVEAPAPSAGTWRAIAERDGGGGDCKTVTHEITVGRAAASVLRPTPGSAWPVRDAWTRQNEILYSAWIEALFDAPLDASQSWSALHDVLRDPKRNLLFNHLGLGEDEKGLIIRPDCADLPYFLRAYFAFKLGLPFGYSKCTRGGGGKPPQCYAWWNIQNPEPTSKPLDQKTAADGLLGIFGAPPAGSNADPEPKQQALTVTFGNYLRSTLANSVHSGSGRTAAADDKTDYYPIPLSQDSLRPGTVYADPYGHLLVLVKRVAQSGDAAGVFLAVDGQPDGTVARKRFWRGNFLFSQDPSLGGPGFKRFRPIVQQKKGGLRRLTNKEIAASPDYGDFSLDASKLSVEEFYDRMDDVMSPEPLDPSRAITEAITALEEQVNARVTSVENGRKHQNSGGGEASMPDGAAIFETTGAWEDFATPSRDLRLLIAIDVVRGYPDRVARRPERYAMPKGRSVADIKADLESLLAAEIAARKFSYARSDGSAWTLTLKDVLDRAAALEVAYNVNDCVEVRWGAKDATDEASTCKRRAPSAQRAKMSEYRAWFSERRRPPRG
ncbi:MAG: hypothetical protein ACT4OU_03060 [Hyphomicrobium sp.]